jgi:hypothetical protein
MSLRASASWSAACSQSSAVISHPDHTKEGITISQLGQYFIIAGTLLGIFFKTGFMSQIAAGLIQFGTGLEAGQGSVGPVRIGNEGVTLTVAPWTGA